MPVLPAATPSASSSSSDASNKLQKIGGSSILLDPKELIFKELLGSGGFGTVSRGFYREKEVAIKRLYTVGVSCSPQVINEFEKEVQVLMTLKHPRLVSIIGATASGTELCMVLLRT